MDLFRFLQLVARAQDRILFACCRSSLGKCGKRSLIEFPARIRHARSLFLGNSVNIHRYAFIFCDAHPQRPGVVEIGNDTYIGHNVHIVAANRVSIGKNVLIADRVFISDCSHGAGDTLSIPPLEREIHSKGPVVIEDNVWIGENAVILPNVRVGTGAVVGANSVVTCNVAPFVAVAGVPARVIMVGKK